MISNKLKSKITYKIEANLMNILLLKSKSSGGIKTWNRAFLAYAKHKNYKVKFVNNVIDLILSKPSDRKILWGPYIFLSIFLKNSVCVSHGIPSFKLQGFKALILYLNLYLANIFRRKVSVISNYTSSVLTETFGIKSVTIRNCIDPDDINLNNILLSNRPIDLLFIGRCIESKLPRFLLETIESRKDLNCHFITSRIPNDKYSKSILKKLNSLPNVKVSSFGKNFDATIYSKSKIFINCSLSEPFAYVYLEALAGGCRVICPCSGGALELSYLINKNWVEVFNKNDPDELSKLITKSLEDYNKCSDEDRNKQKDVISNLFKKLFKDFSEGFDNLLI